MPYPPLLTNKTEAAYRTHYENNYCRGPVMTFDGIGVRFRRSSFSHCFFESTQRNGIKDKFSTKRAERMDWIMATLQDASAGLFEGWDNKRKRYDKRRRVATVQTDYVVVIAVTGQKTADFVTAFIADTPATARRIRSGPMWT